MAFGRSSQYRDSTPILGSSHASLIWPTLPFTSKSLSKLTPHSNSTRFHSPFPLNHSPFPLDNSLIPYIISPQPLRNSFKSLRHSHFSLYVTPPLHSYVASLFPTSLSLLPHVTSHSTLLIHSLIPLRNPSSPYSHALILTPSSPLMSTRSHLFRIFLSILPTLPLRLLSTYPFSL
jgi:hypothetical protein